MNPIYYTARSQKCTLTHCLYCCPFRRVYGVLINPWPNWHCEPYYHSWLPEINHYYVIKYIIILTLNPNKGSQIFPSSEEATRKSRDSTNKDFRNPLNLGCGCMVERNETSQLLASSDYIVQLLNTVVESAPSFQLFIACVLISRWFIGSFLHDTYASLQLFC